MLNLLPGYGMEILLAFLSKIIRCGNMLNALVWYYNFDRVTIFAVPTIKTYKRCCGITFKPSRLR
jgi:hypothetical protein